MSYNYDVTHNSPNYTPGEDALRMFGMLREVEGYTLHWWGDPSKKPSFAGVRDYLCRQNGDTSAHLVVSGTDRQVACIVDYNNVAWHSGSAWGNARTIGIELDPRCRPEDKDVFAEVLADLRAAFGDKPLYWHSYFISTECPGEYTALVDELDQLSYKKYSADEWGKGGWKPEYDPNKVVQPTQPLPEPVKPLPPTPEQQVPSPTATPPEQGGGKPVADKPDYQKKSYTVLVQIRDTLLTLVKLITKILNRKK